MDDWWLEKIEELKRQMQLSDVALSRRLEISPAMLTHFRMGRRQLPLHARICLLDTLGYAITRDILLRILPEEARSAAIAADNRRAQKKGGSEEPDSNTELELPPPWHS